MSVIAGPPGGGKSSNYPVAERDFDYFDADRRCAELNGGSWRSIPQSIRNIVNHEFEAFIEGHIRERKSFTFETTLRSTITFEQARRARIAGFRLEMKYGSEQESEGRPIWQGFQSLGPLDSDRGFPTRELITATADRTSPGQGDPEPWAASEALCWADLLLEPLIL